MLVATTAPTSMDRAKRLARRLPAPAKAGVKQALRAVDPIYVGWFRRRSNETRPVPPIRLRWRIGCPSIADLLREGEEVADQLSTAASAAGLALQEAGSILDFGCGCGRVLMPLVERGGSTAWHGCDVDEEALAWVRANVPRATATPNAFAPPLPYAAGAFDAVFSISIFSHLSGPDQRAWLGELHRVLRPGGLALLSVCGAPMMEGFRSGQCVNNSASCARRMMRYRPLEEEGFVFEPYQRSGWNEEDFQGIEGDYGLAFQSERYVREQWSRHFDIVSHRPRAIFGWQDLVVARRRAD